jgi:hypothetical protein
MFYHLCSSQYRAQPLIVTLRIHKKKYKTNSLELPSDLWSTKADAPLREGECGDAAKNKNCKTNSFIKPDLMLTWLAACHLASEGEDDA